MPMQNAVTETIVAQIITFLKDLHTLIAVSAGKMMRLEGQRGGQGFVSEIGRFRFGHHVENVVDESPAFVPVARAKVSSNVTAKILL